jgi:hypothetical protein
MKSMKLSIILSSAIMAAVVTALFLVFDPTPLFLVAYAFTMLGIGLFCFGKFFMLMNIKGYPWFAAFPITIWRYLATQFAYSATFVLIEHITGWTKPMGWFLLVHIAILGFYTILLLKMNAGREIILAKDTAIKEKVSSIRFMQADVESLMRKFPEHEKDLKMVADAIRYSDPMSHSSLVIYEEQIQRGIIAMGDGENIPAQCAELLRQIADRNGKVKVLK